MKHYFNADLFLYWLKGNQFNVKADIAQYSDYVNYDKIKLSLNDKFHIVLHRQDESLVCIIIDDVVINRGEIKGSNDSMNQCIRIILERFNEHKKYVIEHFEEYL